MLMAAGLIGQALSGSAPPPAPAAGVEHAAPPHRFESTHEGTFGGTRLRYRALVEEHLLTDAAGQRTASVYTMAYLRADTGTAGARRPVVFAFNGGPGSSSIWLHMGLLGPVRVDTGEPNRPNVVAPFRYLDNAQSILDVADIVLIDPPDTGYSRILAAGKPEQFLSTEADARMTVDLMRDWLKDHGRLNAPKYIVSESYGTIRAAVVAKLLAGGPMATGRMDGLSLNGVILLGQAMDMQGDAADRSYLTALPTLAATACQHHKVGGTCTPAGQAEAARRFARDTLLPALYAGNRLDPTASAAVAAQLAQLIGLDRQTVLNHDLRVPIGEFAHALLANEGLRVGLYDSRYTLPLAGAGQDPVGDDPAMSQYVPAYVASWADYARNGLGIDLPLQYEAIAFRDVNSKWDYGMGVGVPMARDFAQDLAVAANHNPALRVFVGAGYFDLVTTLGMAEYTLAHAAIPPERVEFHYYESGHMPYLGSASRQALAGDLRRFITAIR
ncbi:MAG: peptidase S10 [Proteobacteria bacterium]|nr:peptidase S10 [Pseudomonadota bacterium]